MPGNYWVDWSDPPFPEIRSARTATEYADRVTMAQAKQQIVDHFRAQIDHAREQIAITRAVRAADVNKTDEERY